LRQMAWIRTIRCQICGRATGCPDCTRRGPEMTFFQYNRSSVQYSPAMREWLAQYKYRGNERYLAILGRMTMFAYLQVLQQQCIAQQTPGIDCITFVPVSETRLQERGFNQAEQLARIVAQYAQVPVQSLLQRNRHTIKQSMKSRGDRIEDMKDVFSPDPNAIHQLHTLMDRRDTKHSVSRSLRILLVDDVYTTGSTVNVCAQQLKSALDPIHKVEIYSLTWARS
ncbi:ComF family protein, partial [Neobacillus drentensis]|uniref:ComF family protein n=1 Tax=Neobacillus drentensis TaxID=220684 RepID=UPI003002A8F2